MKLLILIMVLLSVITHAEEADPTVDKFLADFDRQLCEEKYGVREPDGFTCEQMEELDEAGKRSMERTNQEALHWWVEQGQK